MLVKMAHKPTRGHSPRGHQWETSMAVPTTLPGDPKGQSRLCEGALRKHHPTPSLMKTFSEKPPLFSSSRTHHASFYGFFFEEDISAGQVCSEEQKINYQTSLETGIGGWLSPFIFSDHFYSHIEMFFRRFHSYVLMEGSLQQMTRCVFLLP